MSQAGILQDSTSSGSDIETITGNTGGPVSPDGAFNINVVGNEDLGFTVVGNPGTNTQTIQPNNRACSTTQTTDATPENIITLPLSASPGSYHFRAYLSCLNTTDSLGAAYTIEGCIRTDGTDTTLCGVPDKIVNEEAGMAGADADAIAGGVGDNNLYIQITGIAAKTIEWTSCVDYLLASA